MTTKPATLGRPSIGIAFQRGWLRVLSRIDRPFAAGHLAAVIVFCAALLFLGSLGGNANGGDTRALVDLAWWIAESGRFQLTGHPIYPADADQFGYWAFRDAEGRVLSIYPPATAVVGAFWFWILSMVGVTYDAGNSGVGAVLVGSIMMSFAAMALWLVIARRYGALCGTVCATLFLCGTLVGPFIGKTLFTQTGGLFCQSVAIIAALGAIHGTRGNSKVLDGVLLFLSGAAACWAYFCRPTFLFWAAPFGVSLLLRLRGEIWKPALGVAVAALLGFWLNSEASGSWRGAYGDKVSDEAGFVFNPLTIWHQAMAVLFSPGRGLLLFSPWIILTLLGVWLAMRGRFKRHGFLVVNAFFVVAVLGIVSAFNMWHGGWSPGPRIQADCALSAAIVAAPAVRWLLIRLWGLPILALLAVPSIDTNLSVSALTRNPPDAHHYRHHETAMTWTWDWETAAFRWYRSGAAPQRQLKGITATPMMTSTRLSAYDADSRRFEGRGMFLNEETQVFSPQQNEAELLFTFPGGTDLPDPLLLVVTLDSRGIPWGSLRRLEFQLNGEVWRTQFLVDVGEPVVSLEVPRELIRLEVPNSFLIIDRRPVLNTYGEVYVGVKSLEFYSLGASSRERVGEKLLRPRSLRD